MVSLNYTTLGIHILNLPKFMLHRGRKTCVVLAHVSSHNSFWESLFNDFDEAFNFVVGLITALTLTIGSVGHG